VKLLAMTRAPDSPCTGFPGNQKKLIIRALAAHQNRFDL
jgi:hypothetical protein